MNPSTTQTKLNGRPKLETKKQLKKYKFFENIK